MPGLVNWNRLWAPPGAQLLSLDGYVEAYWNGCLRPLSKLEHFDLLALVGEPGMGKSSTVLAHAQSGAAADRLRMEYVDLRAVAGDVGQFRRLLEDGCRLLNDRGNRPAYLVLDSLDECNVPMGALGAVISLALRNLDFSGIKFWLCCRSAVFPASLWTDLRQLWPDENSACYELQPLGRTDVDHAAQSYGVDPEKFQSAIIRMRLQPLANRPLTLFMLLDLFRESEQLPASISDLYAQGVDRLLQEQSRTRRESRQTGHLTLPQRRAVAGRVASCIALAGKAGVWIGPPAQCPPGYLQSSDLTGRDEDEGAVLQVTETELREVLETPVFSSRGMEQLGFAHATYGEYLCARYLIERNVPADQLGTLFIHPATGAVVPQLQAVAGWLATWNAGFRGRVLECDPKVLLASDHARTDEQLKNELVGAMLAAVEAGRFWDKDFSFLRLYRGLAHDGLEEQLLAVISDRALRSDTRDFAIHVADQCGLSSVAPALAQIITDSTEDYRVRHTIAYVLPKLATAQTAELLRPLLSIGTEEDPDLELYACALESMWPTAIGTDQLLSLIQRPRRRGYAGAFALFLSSLPGRLSDEDLPVVLQWALDKPAEDEDVDHLVDGATVQAFRRLHAPGVAPLLAKVVGSRLRSANPLISVGHRGEELAEVLKSADNRRPVVRAILNDPDISEPTELGQNLRASGLVTADDVEWIFALAGQEADPVSQQRVGRVLLGAYDWWDESEEGIRIRDVLIRELEKQPRLRSIFAPLTGPVALGSEEATALKTAYARLESRATRRTRVRISPIPKILKLLDEVESGKVDAWWQLNQLLFLDDTGHTRDLVCAHDLTSLPGWNLADELVRSRIIAGAERYLKQGDPSTQEWLGTDRVYWSAMAGYRALHLMLRLGRLYEQWLDAGVWGAWAAIVYAYPRNAPTPEQAREHEAIAYRAYEMAPEAVLEAVVKLSRAENASRDHLSAIDRLPTPWDHRACSAMLKLILEGSLKASCEADLLEPMLETRFAAALDHAMGVIERSQKTDRSRALTVAATLLTHAPGLGFRAVWHEVERDRAFGTELFQKIAAGPHHDGRIGRMAAELSDADVADAYLFLEREWPLSKDSDEQSHKRDDVALLRSGLLSNLEGRGTASALAALRRVAEALPDRAWLYKSVLEGEQKFMAESWEPVTPQSLFQMVASPRRRVVRTEHELLEAVMDALQELQGRLEGHNSPAHDLWAGTRQHPKPKEEDAFSDWVTRYLNDALLAQGVVVNREVQIRRPPISSGIGERTDIYVDAIARASSPGLHQRLTVVIECKGCWNPELVSSMKTQLVERYLAGSTTKTGLYLVACFDVGRWKPRPAKCADRGAIDRELKQQAKQFSEPPIRVEAMTLHIPDFTPPSKSVSVRPTKPATTVPTVRGQKTSARTGKSPKMANGVAASAPSPKRASETKKSKERAKRN